MKDIKAEVALAIELEKKGYNHYAGAAAKTGNPLAKATLKSLADREFLHLHRIEELYKSLTGSRQLGNDWLKDFEIAPSKKKLLSPILQNLKAHLEETKGEVANLTSTYQIAEGFEKESFDLYDRIAKDSKEELTRKFFTALAAEEREHFTILEETLQYLNNPGEWYRQQERWIVEG